MVFGGVAHLSLFQNISKLKGQYPKFKPADYDSLRDKGVSLNRLGKDEEAIEYYDRALKIKPDDYDSLRNKGVSLSKLGKEEDAIKLYDRALEIKPDDYDSLRKKGVSLSKLGKEEDAIKLFDRALEIKPDDYHSLRNKGVSPLLMRHKKYSSQVCKKRASTGCSKYIVSV